MRSNLKARWDAHHVHPRGVVGRLIGARMARQHRPETDWSIALLNLERSDRVLEIGFGAGRALGLIAQQADFVAGLDISRTMVRAARRRYARPIAAGRMAIFQGDVAALPLAAGQFTAIMSIHTYYFWPDPLAMLARLARLLAEDGTLVVTLATGIVGPNGVLDPTPFGDLHATLEQQVVPGMLERGFRAAMLANGPQNRQYNNIALIGHT